MRAVITQVITAHVVVMWQVGNGASRFRAGILRTRAHNPAYQRSPLTALRPSPHTPVSDRDEKRMIRGRRDALTVARHLPRKGPSGNK